MPLLLLNAEVKHRHLNHSRQTKTQTRHAIQRHPDKRCPHRHETAKDNSRASKAVYLRPWPLVLPFHHRAEMKRYTNQPCTPQALWPQSQPMEYGQTDRLIGQAATFQRTTFHIAPKVIHLCEYERPYREQ